MVVMVAGSGLDRGWTEEKVVEGEGEGDWDYDDPTGIYMNEYEYVLNGFNGFNDGWTREMEMEHNISGFTNCLLY